MQFQEEPSSLFASPIRRQSMPFSNEKPKKVKGIGPWDMDSSSSQFDLFCSGLSGPNQLFQPTPSYDQTLKMKYNYTDQDIIVTSISSKTTKNASGKLYPMSQRSNSKQASDTFLTDRNRSSSSNQSISSARESFKINYYIDDIEQQSSKVTTSVPKECVPSSNNIQQILIRRNEPTQRYLQKYNDENMLNLKESIALQQAVAGSTSGLDEKRESKQQKSQIQTASPYNPVIQDNDYLGFGKYSISANSSPRSSIGMSLSSEFSSCGIGTPIPIHSSNQHNVQTDISLTNSLNEVSQTQQAKIHKMIKFKKIQSLRRRFKNSLAGNPSALEDPIPIGSPFSQQRFHTGLSSTIYNYNSFKSEAQPYAEINRDRILANLKVTQNPTTNEPIKFQSVSRSSQNSPQINKSKIKMNFSPRNQKPSYSSVIDTIFTPKQVHRYTPFQQQLIISPNKEEVHLFSNPIESSKSQKDDINRNSSVGKNKKLASLPQSNISQISGTLRSPTSENKKTPSRYTQVSQGDEQSITQPYVNHFLQEPLFIRPKLGRLSSQKPTPANLTLI